MKTFVTGIFVLALAVTIASAVPVPEDVENAPALAPVALVTEEAAPVTAAEEKPAAVTATKQNPVIDGINNFLSNLPALPFSQNAASDNEGAAPSPIESIQAVFSPVVNFFTDRIQQIQALVPGTATPQATKADENSTTTTSTTSAPKEEKE